MNAETNVLVTVANAWFISLALLAIGIAVLLYLSKGSKSKKYGNFN